MSLLQRIELWMVQPRSTKARKGASMVEYALLIALIALVLVVSLTGLKDKIIGVFNAMAGKLTTS